MGRIKLSFICPTAFIGEYGMQSDFILALAHLLDREKENEYEREIKKTSLPIFLDNGTFEGHSIGADELLAKAKRIGAEYVMAPDYLYNRKKTERALGIFAYIKEKQKIKIKTAVTVQASNEEDFIESYKFFVKNPSADLICLSFLAISESLREKNKRNLNYEETINPREITNCRIRMLGKLLKLKEHKPTHLLGLGDSYQDILFAKENCPWVISNDSSCCFQAGLWGGELNDKLEVPGGKVKEKVNFEIRAILPAQKEIIQKNINKVKYAFKSS